MDGDWCCGVKRSHLHGLEEWEEVHASLLSAELEKVTESNGGRGYQTTLAWISEELK